MIQYIGAGILIAGCTLLGCSGTERARQHSRTLRSLIGLLEQMDGQLEALMPPLPQLMAQQSRQAEQPAAEFCGNVVWLTEKRGAGFRSAWERALEDTESLCLLEEERMVLKALGSVLGRCELETQLQTLRRSKKRLELFLELEEKERAQKSKLRAALGAGAGITLAILLL